MLENDELEEVNIKGRKLGQRLNKLEAVLPLKIKIKVYRVSHSMSTRGPGQKSSKTSFNPFNEYFSNFLFQTHFKY